MEFGCTGFQPVPDLCRRWRSPPLESPESNVMRGGDILQAEVSFGFAPDALTLERQLSWIL